MKTSSNSLPSIPTRKSWNSQPLAILAAAALCAGLGWQQNVAAQGVVTDNFDSGALDTSAGGWQVRNVVGALGGFVSDSFPANGPGKALRLQRGSADMSAFGQPQDYGTGRAWLFRTNDYTDFYVAMDIINWNNDTNQAIVLLARGSGFDNSLGGGFPPGLGTTDGYVCNYDNAQDGDGPTDRRGGELQINLVVGEGPATLCAAEVTLIPGHSYRQIFKGTNSTLIGQIYDLEDLTAPLVTIVADDSTYASGKSGIVTFHRDQSVHPNLADMTVDNFYAGPSDPNADIAPAIRHPVAGTPQVVTRTPAKRFTNFHPAASGISFTARTFTAAEINASATKLFLNGVDVSASLAPMPANGSTVSFSTAAGTLTPNTVYAARIELTDTTGTLTSTSTFWFDTFTDTAVAGLPTIEAEDYNYSNGLYQLAPIAVSGLDGNGLQVNGNVDTGGNNLGYFGFTGTPDVDYFKAANGFSKLSLAEYRNADRVQITQGSYNSASDDEAADIVDALTQPPFRINDTQRSQYVATNVLEYQVRLTSPGDWFNYTRAFAPTNYLVFLRCGSFGDTEVYLDRVTSDPTVSGQTTERLGTFNVPNHLMRLNYRYEPLMSGSSPAVLNLSGTNTLRLTIGGDASKTERLVVMDYLLFVPVAANASLAILDTFTDGNDTANPAWVHYDPLGGLGAPFAPASFITTGGVYHIIAPAPPVGDAGPARAGSFLAGVNLTDFYVSADVIDFDDTVRQAFGIAARINNPGLGTTDGYLFSWEPGGGTLPGSTNGDLDISRLVAEAPIGQIETEPSSLHLERGKSYRFVFLGSGTNFEGRVYEYPDLSNPIKTLPGNDPDNLYPSGMVGLIVASQGDITVSGNAIFDNFLATTAEPKLTAAAVGNSVVVTWPQIPFRLQTSPSMSSPSWTDVTSGIIQVGDENAYTVPANGQQYFRLVYP